MNSHGVTYFGFFLQGSRNLGILCIIFKFNFYLWIIKDTKNIISALTKVFPLILNRYYRENLQNIM